MSDQANPPARSLGQAIIDRVTIEQEFADRTAFADPAFSGPDRCPCVSAVDARWRVMGDHSGYPWDYRHLGWVERPGCPDLAYSILAVRDCPACHGTGRISQ